MNRQRFVLVFIGLLLTLFNGCTVQAVPTYEEYIEHFENNFEIYDTAANIFLHNPSLFLRNNPGGSSGVISGEAGLHRSKQLYPDLLTEDEWESVEQAVLLHPKCGIYYHVCAYPEIEFRYQMQNENGTLNTMSLWKCKSSAIPSALKQNGNLDPFVCAQIKWKEERYQEKYFYKHLSHKGWYTSYGLE